MWITPPIKRKGKTMLKALSAFIVDGNVKIHASTCSHVVRDWRSLGTPLVKNAESQQGLIRQLKAHGVRIDSVRVMPCAGIPEGFWSRTPSGAPLRLLDTEAGAKRATRRIERLVAAELKTAVDNMSPYLREALGLTREQ